MTRDELIAELMKHPPDAEVEVEYRYQPACNCAAQDMYCYCQQEEERRGIETVDFCTINPLAHRCPPVIVLRAAG